MASFPTEAVSDSARARRGHSDTGAALEGKKFKFFCDVRHSDRVCG